MTRTRRVAAAVVVAGLAAWLAVTLADVAAAVGVFVVVLVAFAVVPAHWRSMRFGDPDHRRPPHRS